MKIAAPYTENSRWKNIPDEYNLPWGKNSTEQKLLDFCEIIPDKRINIYTIDQAEFDLDAIVKAKELNPLIYVRLNSSQIYLINSLTEKKIQFYFDISYPCYNYTILATMISLNVSDIYIADDLFYNLKVVKDFLKGKNIQIRFVLNRVASTSPNKENDIRGCYISPRDIDIIDQYIDVGEFDCGSNFYDWHKFDVLYQVYFERKEWFGDLRDINDDIKFYYPVYSTLPNSIAWKIRCRRRCSVGNKCNHCEIVNDIAKELYAEGITIKPKRKKMGEKEE